VFSSVESSRCNRIFGMLSGLIVTGFRFNVARGADTIVRLQLDVGYIHGNHQHERNRMEYAQFPGVVVDEARKVGDYFYG